MVTVTPGSKKSFSEVLRGWCNEKIWKRRGKPEKVRSCFLACSKITYREFLATRTAQRKCGLLCSLTLEDLVRLGTRRFVPSPRQSHGWLYPVQRCCFGSHAYFFASTVVRPERKKWNTYSFTELWTIGVLYFFALFFGILLVTSVILHVVMSPVHLDFLKRNILRLIVKSWCM